jgi:hypothetical protein
MDLNSNRNGGSPPPGGDCGTPAPDFTFTDSDGNTSSLRELRGTPLILAFLSSEWDPARSEYLACYNGLLQESVRSGDPSAAGDASAAQLLTVAPERHRHGRR